MKMASKVYKDNVFGKVLIQLRMSKLDYLVKETPCAAYLTVRKGFMKSAVNENDIYSVDNDTMHVKNKITSLKQEIRTTCAMVRIEKLKVERHPSEKVLQIYSFEESMAKCLRMY